MRHRRRRAMRQAVIRLAQVVRFAIPCSHCFKGGVQCDNKRLGIVLSKMAPGTQRASRAFASVAGEQGGMGLGERELESESSLQPRTTSHEVRTGHGGRWMSSDHQQKQPLNAPRIPINSVGARLARRALHDRRCAWQASRDPVLERPVSGTLSKDPETPRVAPLATFSKNKVLQCEVSRPKRQPIAWLHERSKARFERFNQGEASSTESPTKFTQSESTVFSTVRPSLGRSPIPEQAPRQS